MRRIIVRVGHHPAENHDFQRCRSIGRRPRGIRHCWNETIGRRAGPSVILPLDRRADERSSTDAKTQAKLALLSNRVREFALDKAHGMCIENGNKVRAGSDC